MQKCIDAQMRKCYSKDMRTTFTIDDTIYRQLKRRVIEGDITMSKYVEDAIKYQLLEDAEDNATAEARKGEPTYPFDDLVKEFKSKGLL